MTDQPIRSISSDQFEILDWIRALHCPEGFEADATYGKGVFYKRGDKPQHRFDIDPQSDDVTQASSTDLPLADDSLVSMVFDPPFLTYVKGGRGHKDGNVAMTARFGGYWSYNDLLDHYYGSISEFARVLKPHGVLVVKCQDIIHNHRMHCTHQHVINEADTCGFRLLDLFVLTA